MVNIFSQELTSSDNHLLQISSSHKSLRALWDLAHLCSKQVTHMKKPLQIDGANLEAIKHVVLTEFPTRKGLADGALHSSPW